MILLDTTVLIDVLRGYEVAVAYLMEETEPLALSAPLPDARRRF